MKHVRKFGVLAAALVAALGLTAFAPAEAEAAGCGAKGNLIKYFPINSPTRGEQIGSLNVYYSKDNGGTNTACVFHYNRTWGEGLKTLASIRRCGSYYDCNRVETPVKDEGHYQYYAGPVRVTNTRRNCVSVYAALEDRYSDRVAVVSAENVGCEAEVKVDYRSYDPNDTSCMPGRPC